jgi:DnaK suppressor protein
MNNPKTTLISKLEELRGSLRQRDGLTIEAAAEETEMTRNLAERDIEALHLTNCSTTVREILDALARVDHGEYGVCIDCEELISERRLQALPWAKRCIHCQERADRRGRSGSHFGWTEELAAA